MRTVIKSKMLLMFIIPLGLLIITGIYPVMTLASGAPEWPARNITLIVPYNPGGGFDLVSRATAPYIEKHLPKRVPVMVKNVPGAGTRIGTRELVKAKPDGLTIGIFEPVGLCLMERIGQLEWLDVRKLSWLVQLDNLADMLVVGPKTGFKTPNDMKGKTVRFQASDDGNIVRSTVLSRSMGCTPAFVRYGGTGEAVLASLRGDLDGLNLSWSSGMVQVKATNNQMFPLLVTRKVPGLDVPSAQEFGIEADHITMDHPHFLAAPPGLPDEIMRIWKDVFSKVFKDPEWFKQMDKLGFPASPLLETDKLEVYINALMGKMEMYKGILSGVSLIK